MYTVFAGKLHLFRCFKGHGLFSKWKFLEYENIRMFIISPINHNIRHTIFRFEKIQN